MGEEITTSDVSKDKTGSMLKNIAFVVIVIIPSAIGSFLMLNPEYLSDKANTAVIENRVDEDVTNLKKTIKAELLIEFNDKIEKADKEHASCNTKLVGLQSQVNDLQDALNAINNLIEGLDKQTEFNTHNSSTNAEAIFDLMHEDKSCKEVKYTKNPVDRYVLWEKDWYEHPTLQRITARSGCGVTINAYNRDRIREQYPRR